MAGQAPGRKARGRRHVSGKVDMIFDSVGLGYTAVAGQILVHYPRRAADGSREYGAGFPIGDIPSWYWTDPPNDITAERVTLWRGLLGGQEHELA